MKAWLEATNLLLPGHNDSSAESDVVTAWIAGPVGTGIPARLKVVRADDRIRDVPPPCQRVRRKRADAVDGLHARIRTAHSSAVRGRRDP